MAELGKYNHLTVTRRAANGAYLDGGELGEILLPTKFVREDLAAGDDVDAFIFKDSLDRLTATTEKPFAVVGEFAHLRVTSVTPVGAFLDWGLGKELLAPFREQKQRMEAGKYYVVYIYIDAQTNRIAASSKLDHFMSKDVPEYAVGEEVNLLVEGRTDLGYKVIINNRHRGIVYMSEVFRKLEIGEKTAGYIKKVREDGKVDVIVDKPGVEKIEDLSQKILEILREQGGFIAVHDQTDPQTVYRLFGASKKSLKKAIGGLYKRRLITLDPDGIRLSDRPIKTGN
jgi:uncharacterized protein